MRLTFEELRAKNKTRMQRWHGTGPEWTIADWAVAFAGEAGELCNAVKKLKRVRGGFANKNDDPTRQLDTEEKALAAIAEELADTIIYADLLADHLGLDLGSAIAAKFNKTSDQYGFPEKLSETEIEQGQGRLTALQIAALYAWFKETSATLVPADAHQMFIQLGRRLIREHDLFRMFYEHVKESLGLVPNRAYEAIAKEVRILEDHLGK